MKCNYCGADLVDGNPICPACGKENLPEQEPVSEEVLTEVTEEPAAEPEVSEAAEATETPAVEIKEGMKATPGKIALAVVSGVLLLAVLISVIISGFNGNAGTPDPTETVPATTPAETVVEGTIPPDGNPDDVTCKGSYTVSDEEAIAARNDVVATMGDAVLTNGQLQIFYWEEVFAFLQEYGVEYAAYFGLDYTKPLDTQLCETGDISLTWQQYFLRSALNNWNIYQALDLEGEASGFELPEDYITQRDSFGTNLEEAAVKDGFANADDMIRQSYGAGPVLEDFLHFARINNEGYLYFEHVYNSFEVTDEDVEAYFTQHEAEYSQNGITRDGKFVDVRHVLIMPEGATSANIRTETFPEEAWAASEKKAQELYDQWKSGDMSEDSFAQLAMDHSQDGSASTGGLYTDVYQGYMVEAFDAWCFDESRQPGDHGIVKTEFGYHIMYFVGSESIWFETAKEDLLSEKSSTTVPAAVEKHPMEVDFSAIKLGLRDLTK